MLSTFAFIFARGGSKGLPRKNLLPINGIPLIGHSINVAKQVKEIDEIFLSTDSEEITQVAEGYGVKVINRPKELASDSAPEWLAWQHAIHEVEKIRGEFKTFISLPATAPLKQPSDVIRCLKALTPEIDIVLTISPSNRNPWFNMVRLDDDKNLQLIVNNKSINRRQDAPDCYDITTLVYAAKPSFILNSSTIWDGKVAGIKIPIERSIDIDTLFDFSIAKFLMEDLKVTSNLKT